MLANERPGLLSSAARVGIKLARSRPSCESNELHLGVGPGSGCWRAVKLFLCHSVWPCIASWSSPSAAQPSAWGQWTSSTTTTTTINSNEHDHTAHAEHAKQSVALAFSVWRSTAAAEDAGRGGLTDGLTADRSRSTGIVSVVAVVSRQQ